MDGRNALPTCCTGWRTRFGSNHAGWRWARRKRKYYSIKKDGHQALKESSEQWSLILRSALGGLWKGQHV